MNNSLIKQISFDLNIGKYSDETNEEYGNRLVYTALAAWARNLVLGESYTDLNEEAANSNYHNVDIMHIQSRLTQIAYGMLTVIPHSKTWFGNGSIEIQSSTIASNIIDNLIFCYELSRLNDARRLTNSPIRNAAFKNNELVLGGEQWQNSNKTLISVGLGRWMQDTKCSENYKEIFNLPNYTYDEYYHILLDSVLWKESNLDGKYKIFKTGTGLFYNKAWQDFIKGKLARGLSLLKSIEVDGGYLLVNRDKDQIYSARLDKWYYEEKEIYRIMYMLDSHNETPAIFKAKKYNDYILLHCHSILPNPEMRIILMSSWPGRFFNDFYYRIIPNFIWDEIENLLTNLGIKIEYIDI